MATGAPSVKGVPFNVTVAPGSTPNAPVTTAINLGDIFCYSVDFVVPRGPNALMGFNLSYAGSIIVPWSPSGAPGSAAPFLIVNDWQENVTIEAEIGASLSFVAYNQGFWPHTVYMRFNSVPISAYLGSVQAPVTTLAL